MCLAVIETFRGIPQFKKSVCAVDNTQTNSHPISSAFVWVRRGGRVGSWWGNRRERDHWGELGVDGWIILGWIYRRWDVGMWTGLGWPRIGTGGGRF